MAKQGIDHPSAETLAGAAIKGEIPDGDVDGVLIPDEDDFEFFYAFRDHPTTRVQVDSSNWQIICNALFGISISQNSVFRTNNVRFLNGIYFPIELASFQSEGCFDERLSNYLLGKGIVPKGAEVIRILDCGGWDNMATLVARMEVWWRHDGNDAVGALLEGLPLIQPFGVHIHSYRQMLRSRISLLSEYCVACSIVDVTKSTLIVRRFIQSNTDQEYSDEFVCELARMCALVDSRLLAVVESVAIKTDFGSFTDVFDLSAEDILESAKPWERKIGKAIDLSGALPSWCDVSRSFRAYSGGGEFLRHSLRLEPRRVQRTGDAKYQFWLQEFRDQLRLLL